MLVAASSPAPHRRLPALARPMRGWNAPPHPRLGRRARHRRRGFVLVWPQVFGLQNQWVAAHVVALRGVAAGVGIVAASSFALLAIPRAARVASASRWRPCSRSSRPATSPCSRCAASAASRCRRGRRVRHRHRARLEHPRRGARRADDRRPRPRRGRRRRRAARDDRPARRGGRDRDARGRQPDVGAHAGVRRDLEGAIDDAAHQPRPRRLRGDLGRSPVRPATPTRCRASSPTRSTATARASSPCTRSRPSGGSCATGAATSTGSPSSATATNVIMAGDFNATLDHFAGRGTDGGDLGRCADAAARRPTPRRRHLADRRARRCSAPRSTTCSRRRRLDGRRVPRDRRRSTAPAATTAPSSRTLAELTRSRRTGGRCENGDMANSSDTSTTETAAQAVSDEEPGRNANRSTTPSSEAFKDFIGSGWAERDEMLAVAARAGRRSPPPVAHASRRAFPGKRLDRPGRRREAALERHRLPLPRALGVRPPHRLGRPTPCPGAVLVFEPTADGHDATLYFRERAGRDSEEFYANPAIGEFWTGAAPVARPRRRRPRPRDARPRRVRPRRRCRRRRDARAARGRRRHHRAGRPRAHPLRRRAGALDERADAPFSLEVDASTSPTPSSPASSASCAS